MAEIRVPTLGESVTEATIGKWFKKPGDAVAVDEPLVELETDKVTIEVPAPAAGVLGDIAAKDGETVAVGALLGQIKEGAGGAPRLRARARRPRPAGPTRRPRPRRRSTPPTRSPGRACRRRPTASRNRRSMRRSRRRCAGSRPKAASMPRSVDGSGKDGRVTKGDMLAAIERAASQPTPVAQPASAVHVRAPSPADDAAREERVKMTRLRQTIARRLKDAQNTAAMLTTFNEVDMSAVMAPAQPVQGSVREEARRQARLHGLLRARLRAGAERHPGGQRRDRRQRHRSTRTTITSASRSAPRRASWCRWCATPTSSRSRRSRRRSPISASARATASSRSRRCRAAPSPSPTAASTAR